jgi:hypothetical protein
MDAWSLVDAILQEEASVAASCTPSCLLNTHAQNSIEEMTSLPCNAFVNNRRRLLLLFVMRRVRAPSFLF